MWRLNYTLMRVQNLSISLTEEFHFIRESLLKSVWRHCSSRILLNLLLVLRPGSPLLCWYLNLRNLVVCDSVWICERANKAIAREAHLKPTIDEIIHDLDGASVFSTVDLNQGYHQLELHPDSRHITTFSTHTGLFRYKRLRFGIK